MMSKHHKISICMLCVLILLLCIVGCQEKKRTPQEMSDDELRIAVLSEVNLSEMWYYSNEDYTLNIPIGISLMVEKYPAFREAVERDVFGGVDVITMKELLGNRECVATDEEKETFLTEYQGWKESFGGKVVDSEILKPYRTLLDVEWKRNAETGRYEYPLTPETAPDKWFLLSTDGKHAVCDAPENVLEDVTDDELVDLVLRYPMLNDVYYYMQSEFHYGVEKVAEYFKPMKIMHERKLLIPFLDAHWEEVKDQYDGIVETFVKDYRNEFGH